jgi:hypothetical protein
MKSNATIPRIARSNMATTTPMPACAIVLRPFEPELEVEPADVADAATDATVMAGDSDGEELGVDAALLVTYAGILNTGSCCNPYESRRRRRVERFVGRVGAVGDYSAIRVGTAIPDGGCGVIDNVAKDLVFLLIILFQPLCCELPVLGLTK